jgi:hypothetical protein
MPETYPKTVQEMNSMIYAFKTMGEIPLEKLFSTVIRSKSGNGITVAFQAVDRLQGASA